MLAFRPILIRSSPVVTVLALLLAVPGVVLGSGPNTFTITERTIAQETVPQEKAAQDPKWFWQAWQVDYVIRHDGPSGVILTPAEISAIVEGWVSNSRVPGHASPRRSSLTVTGSSGLSATTDVIESSDEAQRCRERALLQVWVGNHSEDPPCPAKAHDDRTSAGEEQTFLSLAPGASLHVRLRLVHQHFLYGMYDPLLGQRTLEMHLGPATVHDVLPLDQERHIAQAVSAWSTFPEERRDTRQFVSPPDSLHLEAHIPGNQYYRFPEQPVRYATKMRLSYWYLIAPGTEGECKARVAQYKDTPTAWKVLSDGAHEDCLSTVGRWVRVERTFRTEPDATTLALDFRIVGADVGELWIDDVTLEPVNARPEGP